MNDVGLQKIALLLRPISETVILNDSFQRDGFEPGHFKSH
jgi:hypothetical protein